MLCRTQRDGSAYNRSHEYSSSCWLGVDRRDSVIYTILSDVLQENFCFHPLGIPGAFLCQGFGQQRVEQRVVQPETSLSSHPSGVSLLLMSELWNEPEINFPCLVLGWMRGSAHQMRVKHFKIGATTMWRTEEAWNHLIFSWTRKGVVNVYNSIHPGTVPKKVSYFEFQQHDYKTLECHFKDQGFVWQGKLREPAKAKAFKQKFCILFWSLKTEKHAGCSHDANCLRF
jgi:hypothetical protein